MKVNVVHHADAHIIPRMAKWLADYHGWSEGVDPDPSADVNFFLPYTAFRDVETKTAAWFTHYENARDDVTGKRHQWHMVANKVDLRCITSPLYNNLGINYGPTRILTPGVDRDLFAPGNNKDMIKGRLGVVGIAQPRKGPNLVRIISELGYDVVSSSANWGVDFFKAWTEYEEMPSFYHSIEIMVCTSLVEGIPAPPLEALACGTKVVVPDGVGIMDELPKMKGIRHYSAGDGNGMIDAIELALKDKVDPFELRDASKKYTVEAWCLSARDALKDLNND